MNELRLDLRDAVRSMRRNPGFTATIVLILALGIGANSALFGIVNAVLLRPLPYPGSDRIVSIASAAGGGEVMDDQNVRIMLGERTRSFQALAAFEPAGANLTGGAEPERVGGGNVSPQFFRVMGVHPTLGREFSPEEVRPGGQSAVILAHSLWLRDFGGDPAIIGRSVKLDDVSHTVVGVMPAGFAFPRKAEYWSPLELPLPEAGSRYYEYLIGRLRPDVTLDAARAEIGALQRFHAEELGVDYDEDAMSVMSLHERTYGDLRPALLILLGTVGCVLLIACTNVANLLLARAAARRRELAVRAALGASRARLVRQLFVESVLIALLGGAFGLVVAINALGLFTTLAPARLTRVPGLTLDSSVLLFTLAVSLLTGLLFGLAPAFAIARTELSDLLKSGGQRTTRGNGSARPRRLLVTAQLALAVVLLVGAGLLVKSFVRFRDIDPGFDADGILRATVVLPDARYSNPAAVQSFFSQALERVRAIPGVDAATLSDIAPLGGSRMMKITKTDAAGVVTKSPMIAIGNVGTEYFRTFRIPLRAGRDLTDADGVSAPRVAIVNESMARYFFPGKPAVGERLSAGARAPYTIVGVVADVRMTAPRAESPPAVYFPLLQSGSSRSASISVRARSDPIALIPAIRQAVRSVDPEQPIASITTMDAVLAEFMAPRRFNALLLGAFASLALVLAAVGLYGVIAFLIAQRTHEIGVRMALGAERRDVITMVLRQGMLLTLSGVAIGLAASLALTRLLSGMLFRVEARDPVVFTAVPIILVTVAALAVILPARRASRVDPATALRTE